MKNSSESKLKELMKNSIDKIGDGGISCSEDYLYNKGKYTHNWDYVKEILLEGNVPKEFETLYDQAIGGSGCEGANMTNIISSALWAFLFFANVSEEYPLTIDNVKYVHVCFEFKNRTLEGNSDSAPSNMDVVLADKEYKNIMFVESKFGEYVYSRTRSYKELSVKYASKGNTKELISDMIEQKNIYANYLQKEEKFRMYKNKDAKNNEKIFFEAKGEHYFEGLKQMITHISGLGNFRDSDKRCIVNTVHIYDKDKEMYYKNAKTASIVLQEILFDFGKLAELNGESRDEYNEAFKDYKELHEILAKSWNENYSENEKYGNFKVGDLLTYQDIAEKNMEYVENALPQNVRNIYAI